MATRLPVATWIIQRSPESARTRTALGPKDSVEGSRGIATTGRSRPSNVGLA